MNYKLLITITIDIDNKIVETMVINSNNMNQVVTCFVPQKSKMIMMKETFLENCEGKEKRSQYERVLFVWRDDINKKQARIQISGFGQLAKENSGAGVWSKIFKFKGTYHDLHQYIKFNDRDSE